VTTQGFGPRPGELWQTQLNQAFPPDARHIPDRPRQIPVWVRVVWEADGEEWCAGSAARWTRTHVLVWFSTEPRSQIGGIWVVPGDVRRRVVPAPDGPDGVE
jgi:hypothetical protein